MHDQQINQNDRLARLQRTDEACDRFEHQWQAGQIPRVEDFLAAAHPGDRAALLEQLLLLEWTYRRNKGESFSLREYEQRFADWRAVVEQAWQSLKQVDTDPRATVASMPGGSAQETLTTEGAINPLPFTQITLLGKGGMGEVFKAFDPNLKRWVALKQLRLEFASPDSVERLRLEAEALARLRHPHIVKLFGFSQRAGQPTLEMELVTGGNLEERLAKLPVSSAEAARLVAILAWAMHAAHDMGIVHRDLKPANVLMDALVEGNPGNVLDGFPKITDFGLATLANARENHTLSGTIMGTPNYMSPEQALGKTREIGPATDVWALGVILFRCLTGELPFQGDSILDTLERIKTMQMRPPREVRPDVPAELADICLACLRREASERPTAKGLAERLEGLVPSEPIRRPAARKASAVRWMLAVAGLALAVGLGLGGWWLRTRPVAEQVQGVPAVKLRVMHYEREGGKDLLVGIIGNDSSEARFKDRVVLSVETPEPAYCYLIGFNFDGEEQLLWPCDESKAPHAGDRTQVPPRRSQFHYPPKNAETGKLFGLSLDDDARGGVQAFLVVSSAQPLPPYQQWRQQRGKSPWSHLPATAGVWRTDGETLSPITRGDVRDRGKVVELEGHPPLLKLSSWARGPGVDRVEAIAFPVRGE